jgi:hypothetical protein
VRLRAAEMVHCETFPLQCGPCLHRDEGEVAAVSDVRTWTFGTHTARFEQPDLLLLHFKGPTTVEDAQRTVELLRSCASNGPIFFVANVADSSIDGKARKHLTDNVDLGWLRGIVYVGAGTLQRTMSKAILVALYITRKWTHDMEFVSTDAEARARIAELRARQSPRATG